MSARSEIEIDAPPEDVWEAVSTEESRERWLDDDRPVTVEAVEEPHRLVWWWQDGDDAFTRVEIAIAPAGTGSRVTVTESVPGAFPLPMLAACLSAVAA